MEPNIWGQGAWLFLHSITLNYPNKPTTIQKKLYSDFFYNLGNILPCSKCQKNYKHHLNENPIKFHLQSKESLSKWLVEIHNKVNTLNKKDTMSYSSFIQYMDMVYKNPSHSITYYKSKNTSQRYTIYFLIFVICSLIFYKTIQNKYFQQ